MRVPLHIGRPPPPPTPRSWMSRFCGVLPRFRVVPGPLCVAAAPGTAGSEPSRLAKLLTPHSFGGVGDAIARTPARRNCSGLVAADGRSGSIRGRQERSHRLFLREFTIGH